jgi:hypothetical protein
MQLSGIGVGLDFTTIAPIHLNFSLNHGRQNNELKAIRFGCVLGRFEPVRGLLFQ